MVMSYSFPSSASCASSGNPSPKMTTPVNRNARIEPPERCFEATVFSTAIGRGKFFGRPVPQRAVRAHRVVVHPPGLDHLACVSEIHEPVLVQAFIPELAVEAFDECILCGLATLDEVQRHLVLIGPLIHDA